MVSCEALLDRLRDILHKRGTRGITALGKWFHIADTNRSMSLDEDEFCIIMRRMRMGLSPDEAHALFHFFDRDGSGQVDYNEFLRTLRGTMNDFRRALAMKAYAILDANGDNTITLDEIRMKYNVSPKHPDIQSGRKTEQEVLLEFIETFEGESENKGDGIITVDEWLSYYDNVSASIDRDDYFELMMNSAWRLGEYAQYSNKARGAALEVGSKAATAAPPQRFQAGAPAATPTRGVRAAAPVGAAQAATPTGVGAAAGTPTRAGGAATHADPRADITVNMLKDKMRAVLKQRGSRGISSLGKWFRRSDLDKSGKLDEEEFAVICKRLRVGLTPEQVTTLFHGFDYDNSGEIDYDEFLQALRGELSPTRLRVVEQAWKKFDRTGDGQVDMDDIRDVYTASGHPAVKAGKKTEQEVLLEFLETFEVRGRVDGTITREEFIEYYKNISASIDDDAYFVLCVNSAWKMGEYANKDWTRKGTRMDY